MPASMEIDIAIMGSVCHRSAPPMMRETAELTMKIEAMPMRNNSTICMMAGSSSRCWLWGGSST